MNNYYLPDAQTFKELGYAYLLVDSTDGGKQST